MRFWDSSAIVPLLIREPRSAAVARARSDDPAIAVAWTTEVECASAIARAGRDGRLDSPLERAAFERLDLLAASWTEVDPAATMRRTAVRLLRVHQLRAADAIQLASALAAAEADARTLPFVTFDRHLAEAAEREGFGVVTPGT